MTARTRPQSVYLSYAARDRALAEKLRHELEAHGLRAWTEASGIEAGENWAEAVAQALKRADALVFLISPEWVSSPWTRHEVGMAISGSRFDQRVFPVLVRATDDYPWILRHMDPLLFWQLPHGVPRRKAIGGLAEIIARRLGRSDSSSTTSKASVAS